MLKAKRRHYFELYFGTLGLILFVGLIYFIVDNQGNKAQIKEIENEIENSYNSD